MPPISSALPPTADVADSPGIRGVMTLTGSPALSEMRLLAAGGLIASRTSTKYIEAEERNNFITRGGSLA